MSKIEMFLRQYTRWWRIGSAVTVLLWTCVIAAGVSIMGCALHSLTLAVWAPAGLIAAATLALLVWLIAYRFDAMAVAYRVERAWADCDQRLLTVVGQGVETAFTRQLSMELEAMIASKKPSALISLRSLRLAGIVAFVSVAGAVAVFHWACSHAVFQIVR